MPLSTLAAALARATAARKSLGAPLSATSSDPPAMDLIQGLEKAVARARKALDGLCGVRKDVSPPVAAGGAPDPTADTMGDLTATAPGAPGALPPEVGIPRRRRHVQATKAGMTGSDAAVAQVAAVARGMLDPGGVPFVMAPVPLLGDTIPDPIVTDYHGLCIVIDRPAGFVQTKLADDGSVAWTRTYTCNYGFLPDTCGGDADELDCFMSGPIPEGSENFNGETVYWFIILDDNGDFDEYKLVIAANSEADARRIILAHIPPQYVAPGVAVTSVAQIKALLGCEPIEREATMESVSKSLDRVECRYKALVSARKALAGPEYKGAQLLPPELAQHPALTAPMTELYPKPEDVGGWLGVLDGGDWVAFVGVDGKALLWTDRDADGGVAGTPYEFRRDDLVKPAQVSALKRAFEMVQVGKAAAPEEHYVLGAVLVPEQVDAQGEVYSADVIRDSAFNWLSDFRNIDIQHKVFVGPRTVRVVESYIAPQDLQFGERIVKQGTWLLAVIVEDDSLWEAIKRGEFTGFSMNGLSRKEPVAA